MTEDTPGQDKKIGAPKPAVEPDRQKVVSPPEPVAPQRKKRRWTLGRRKDRGA